MRRVGVSFGRWGGKALARNQCSTWMPSRARRSGPNVGETAAWPDVEHAPTADQDGSVSAHELSLRVLPPPRSVPGRNGGLAIYHLGRRGDCPIEVERRRRSLVYLQRVRTLPDHSLVRVITETPEVCGDIPEV